MVPDELGMVRPAWNDDDDEDEDEVVVGAGMADDDLSTGGPRTGGLEGGCSEPDMVVMVRLSGVLVAIVVGKMCLIAR